MKYSVQFKEYGLLDFALNICISIRLGIDVLIGCLTSSALYPDHKDTPPKYALDKRVINWVNSTVVSINMFCQLMIQTQLNSPHPTANPVIVPMMLWCQLRLMHPIEVSDNKPPVSKFTVWKYNWEMVSDLGCCRL